MVFASLVKKEVMVVLKSPAFIVGVVLLVVYFSILGRAIGVATEQAAREVVESYVGVVSEDVGYVTYRLLQLANTTLSGRLIKVPTVEEGLGRFPAVVVVPKDFGDSLLRNSTLYLYGYVNLDSVSLAQSARVQLVNSVARVLEELARALAAAEKGVNVSDILRTLIPRVEARVGGRVVDFSTLSSLLFSVMMFVYMVGLLGVLTLMYSSQSVATEKEEKAFEMLLTLPISRTAIAVAKVVGAVVLSLIMVVAYFAGFSVTLVSIRISEPAIEGQTVTAAASLWNLMQFLGGEGMALLALSLGLMLVFSGSLGLLVGSVSSDTRVAGAIAGPVGAVLFVGLLASQFTGIPLNPLSSLLGASVYGLPLAILVSYALGDRAIALQATGLATAVTLLTVLVVVRVFSSERILIGISLRRRRPR
jgi:ABC-2 type transport system permease protein